jgi:hypothetical protein
MKKILVISIALLLVASSSFAAPVNSTSGKLVFGTSVGTDNLSVNGIGLSPKVVAIYNSPGTDAVTSQWYSIGTVHPGGNMAYGTAQNLNNLFSKVYTTGDATATVLGTIPAVVCSDSVWISATWNP